MPTATEPNPPCNPPPPLSGGGERGRSALVCLMGCPLDTGNLGVSALGVSVTTLLKLEDPSTRVEMLLGRRRGEPYEYEAAGRTIEVPVTNFRLSPRAGLRQNLFAWLALAVLYRAVPLGPWRALLRRRYPLIRLSADADVVADIRGGDSFSDIYGLRGFLLSSIPAVCVLLVRHRMVMLPQTYGPFASPVARRVAAYILGRSSLIFSRDRESMGTVERLVGNGQRCHLCPDVAFSLEASPPHRVALQPPLPAASGDHLIGISVNAFLYHRSQQRREMFGLALDYPRFVLRLVERLLAESNTRVLLVAHTLAAAGNSDLDDRVACRKVRDQLRPDLQARVHVTEGTYDQGEIKAIIGRCEFFVGSRMHACIAALSQGIPAVGVAYSKKFAGVFDTVGAGEWVVDGRAAGDDEAIERTITLFGSRAEIRAELVRRVHEAKALHRQVFARLLHEARAKAR